MANHLRLSEKWFNRGLWLIAIIFAYFLIGLGGIIVGDLPQIESKISYEDFINQDTRSQLKEKLKSIEQNEEIENEKLQQAELKQQTANVDYQTAKQAFDAWISTRTATQKADQDKDLINRTKNLDQLRTNKREYSTAVESIQKKLLDSSQKKAQVNREISNLENNAREEFREKYKKIELRVFLYRLLFVLPLLLVAGFLFVKFRKKTYWPFVWGFILFSLFAFFVELVPYLPSYGGYVRYIVGLIITLVIGKYSISALQKYIERQRELEKQPESKRKKDIAYDLALSRISKGICPSCERQFNKEKDNFCQHCGLEIFDKCNSCQSRKIAFSKYCFNCGTAVEKAVT